MTTPAMADVNRIDDAASQLGCGPSAPSHQHLVLRTRNSHAEKRAISPLRSESTASRDSYFESATAASKSESTRETSVPTHPDSSISVSLDEYSCGKPKCVEPADGEASVPSHLRGGPRRGPKSRQRPIVMIIDARTDSVQQVKPTTGPECYHRKLPVPNRYPGSEWREKSHPIPYTGAYSRLPQRTAIACLASWADIESVSCILRR